MSRRNVTPRKTREEIERDKRREKAREEQKDEPVWGARKSVTASDAIRARELQRNEMDKHEREKEDKEKEKEKEKEYERDTKQNHAVLVAPELGDGTGSTIRVEPLQNFCSEFDRWQEIEEDQVDSRTFVVTMGHTLQDFVITNKDLLAEENPNVILLAGHQSAGKTTECMALTRQVALLIDPHTGTKAATFMTSSYAPELDETVIAFNYKDIRRENLTTDQMFDLYNKTFANAPFDTQRTARVTVRNTIPSFGVSVLDHPGFVLSDQERHTVTITQQSIDRYFPADKKPSGVLLLCHSITHSRDDGGWTALKRLERIPPGHFIVAMTRMDRLNIGEIASRIFSYAEKNSKKNPFSRDPEDTSRIAITPLGLLEFLELEMKLSGHIPQHAQFFFVASSDATTEELKRTRDAQDRWELFERRQTENEAKMVDLLTMKGPWKEKNILLIDMNEKEQQRFDERVGQNRLLSTLLKRQHEGLLRMAEGISKYIQEKRAQEREAFVQHKRALTSSKGIPSLVNNFIDQYIGFYHTIARGQPYDSTLRGEDRIGFKAIYDRLEDRLGWTKQEEIEIYESLRDKAQFPPLDRALDDFSNVYQQNLPRMVRPMDVKLHTLSTLIRRTEAEYAFLSSCISIPEITGQEILRKQSTNPGLQAGDLKEPLATHVANEYNKLYHSSAKGGNHWAAVRTAMCILMHAQTTATVVCSHPEFSDLFASPSGETVGLDLLGELKRSGGSSPQPPSDIHQRVDIRPRDLETNKLADLMQKTRTKVPKGNPRDDLTKAITAMFYYSPVEKLKEQLDSQTLALALTQPAFIAACLHFAPMFLYQDKDFLREYMKHNGSDEYAQAFLGKLYSIGEEEENNQEWKLGDLFEATEAALKIPLLGFTEADKVVKAIGTIQKLLSDQQDTSVSGDIKRMFRNLRKKLFPKDSKKEKEKEKEKDKEEEEESDGEKKSEDEDEKGKDKEDDDKNPIIQFLDKTLSETTFGEGSTTQLLIEFVREVVVHQLHQNKEDEGGDNHHHHHHHHHSDQLLDIALNGALTAASVIRPEFKLLPNLLATAKRLKSKPNGIDKSVQHRYTDSDGSIFSWCHDKPFQEVAEMIHTLDALEPMEQANLLSSLIRMSAGPDIVSKIQSASELSTFETAWLNYVNRRYIAAGIYNSLHGTLKLITSFTYPYIHPEKLDDHRAELRGRYISLLLGYGFPFKEDERPRKRWWLNPDNVIPFLMRYREAITGAQQGGDRMPILDTDMKFARSPLLKRILSIVEHPDQGGSDGKLANRDEAKRVIASLYQFWSDKDDVRLNTLLIEILAADRYKHISPKDIRQDMADKSRNRCAFWSRVDNTLSSYIRFLQSNGQSLVGLHPLSYEVRSLRPQPIPDVMPDDEIWLDEEDEDEDEESDDQEEVGRIPEDERGEEQSN